MTSLVLRRLVAVSCLSVSFLAVPSEGHAACCLFEKLFGSQPATTTANYCCAPVVANYVPQTAYRPVVVNVPVTTYRPCISCDPCTGCPTTVMMPSTCVMQQTRMVPYTTYRLQYANTCNTCQRPCSTCQTTAAYAAPASSCSTCNSGYAASPVTATMAAPARPGCSSCGGGANTAPALSTMSSPAMSMPSSTAGSTFATEQTSGYRDYQTLYGGSGDSSAVPYPGTSGSTHTTLQPTPAPRQPIDTDATLPKVEDKSADPQTPIPDLDRGTSGGSTNSSTSLPSLNPQIGNPQDKTTQYPGRQVWAPSSMTGTPALAARPAAAKTLGTIVPVSDTQPPSDTIWRASNR